jgi:hypothetical protein
MKKKFLFKFFLLTFLFLFHFSFAQNNPSLNSYPHLGNMEVNGIFYSLPAPLRIEAETRFIRGRDSKETIAALCIIQSTTISKVLTYFLNELPADTLFKIGEVVTKLIISYGKAELAGLIDKIEDISVKESIDYLLNVLLANQIKVNTGNLELQYTAKDKSQFEANFQYILIYKEIGFINNKKRAMVILRIYSPQNLKPPIDRGDPFAPRGNLVSLNSEIPPFILDIKGIITEEDFKNYQWLESPQIEIDFNSPVPDFGFQSPGFLERNIANPLKERLNKILAVAESYIKTIKIFTNIKIPLESLITKVKNFIADFSPWKKKTTNTPPEVIKKEIENINTIINSLKTNNNLSLNSSALQERDTQINQKDLKQTLDFKETTQKEDNKENNIIKTSVTSTISQESNQKNDLLKTAISFCQLPSEEEHLISEVIFNEIAWMGTTNSANDEWIELKNISGKPQNLEGWQLQNKDGKIKLVFQKATLPAGGFFLLERTDDNTLPQIKADQIFTGAIKNSNETLYLFDKDCKLQDMVIAKSDWPAGDNSSKRTMERQRFNFGWQSSEKPGGTPKAENSYGYFPKSPTSSSQTSNQKSNNQQTSNKQSQNTLVSSGGLSQSPPNTNKEPSICSLENLPLPVYSPVIFNEIAWMGSSSSSNAEWIELKNISTTSISLTNWQIIGLDTKDNKNEIKIKIFFNQKNINPNDYFLLERTDDNTVPGISADLFFTNNLNDSNFSLYLFDQNCNLVDKIEATSSWPGGEKTPNKRTAERDENLNWYTSCSSFSINGLFGTPKAENSICQENLNSTTTDSKTTINYAPLDVVINEIAWAGTVSSSNDEWLELYNNTNKSIDLNNWKIVWGEEATNTHTILLNKIIPAYGFYLLERTSSTTISDIEEDQIYTGSLKDSGEHLKLLDSNGNIIDEINCKTRWFAGDSKSKKTMERINPRISGNLSENWAANTEIIKRGHDAGGNEILGTPKFKNSVFSNLPPNVVENFLVDKEKTKSQNLFLSWASSTDPDNPESDISYIVYYSKEKIREDNATNTNNFLFSTTTITTTISFLLDYDSTYYFAIRAFDGNNYSLLTTTTPFFTPLPPIQDLVAGPSAIRKAVDLFWSSQGGKGYIIKYSEKEIVEMPENENQISWEEATLFDQSLIPKEKGAIENLTIKNLDPEKTYYFAIKTISQNDALSEISNIAKAKPIPGFQDNKDGTVTDLYTGLMWLKDGNSQEGNIAKSTYKDAQLLISQLNNNNFLGYNDWRLPTIKELITLIDYSKVPDGQNPLIDEVFQNIKADRYWSSSYEHQGGWGYNLYKYRYVDFSSGASDLAYYDSTLDKPKPTFYFLPVRNSNNQKIIAKSGLSGEEMASSCQISYQEDDKTIFENCNNLFWVKGDTTLLLGFDITPKTISWQQGMKICQNLNFQGYKNWRLPNVLEIINIINRPSDFVSTSPIIKWKSGWAYFYWTATFLDKNPVVVSDGDIGKTITFDKNNYAAYLQCVYQK